MSLCAHNCKILSGTPSFVSVFVEFCLLLLVAFFSAANFFYSYCPEFDSYSSQSFFPNSISEAGLASRLRSSRLFSSIRITKKIRSFSNSIENDLTVRFRSTGPLGDLPIGRFFQENL